MLNISFRPVTSKQYFNKFGQVLLKFQQSSYLCDTFLIVKDKEIKAHSVLLAAASPVFKSAIDASGPNQKYFICLPNLNSELVEIILQFVYTGNLELSEKFSSPKELANLIYVFDFLKLDMNYLNGCLVKFKRYVWKHTICTPYLFLKTSSYSCYNHIIVISL